MTFFSGARFTAFASGLFGRGARSDGGGASRPIDEGFRPGQRVRCVAGDYWCSGLGVNLCGPARDAIYVVADVISAPHVRSGKIAEFLHFAAWPEQMFDATCFRPIEDQELERLRALVASPGSSEHELADPVEQTA